MPEYKKKKRNRIFSPHRSAKRNHSVNADDGVIEMTSYKQRKNPDSSVKIKVIRGNKEENRRKLMLAGICIAAVAAIIVLLQVLLPLGIIGSISKTAALIGTGSYPVNLEGNSVSNIVSKDSFYFLLTDNTVCAYSNAGKELLNYKHGFANPIVRTSLSKAIVFDQGANHAVICDYKSVEFTVTSDKPILTAAVSDSGVYALVTRSDKYASTVSVYKKNGKLIYEWYSAEDTVNNVAISKNGRKIAVSTFNSQSGKYISKINVLNFKSASAEFSEELDNNLVYTLQAASSGRFYAVTSNGVKFIKWTAYKKNEYQNEYSTTFFREGKGGYVAVYNRESDHTDNRIAVFAKNGKLKYEINYKGIISDIGVWDGHIYCICDNELLQIDSAARVLRKAECGFGASLLTVTGANTVAVAADETVDSINLSKQES